MNLFKPSPLSLCVALATATLACAAHAHEYEALLKAKKYDEVDRATQAALATNPTQVDALLGRIDLMLAQGQDKQIDEAVKLAEQCVQAHPQNADCHEAVGNSLGSKAIRAGVMSAMGYLGKIRDAFKKAIELDPKNTDARFSLLQYYQQVPGIMGGGSSNAKELVAQTQKINPEAARLMQGNLDLADKDTAKVEAAVLAPLSADNKSLEKNQRGLMVSLGFYYAQEKKYTEALRVFNDIHKRFPDNETAVFGMGRVLQEQGKHAEAIAQFDKALGMKPSAPMHYRIGQSWQALNDKPKAIASYERALGFKPVLGKKQLEDAQEQLKSLKG
ncbi:MAG: hypothetical protein CFE43_15390 [Burkholderiales bacterium PBB3]|nr:MAG: hypothetical protein CFE43_15390 [Burkholderiales bacterium PBB3]